MPYDHNQTPPPQPQQKPEPQYQPQGPEATLRDGAIKASVWRNPGKDRDFFSVSVARTYRDESGVLHDTNSFIGTDLLRLSELTRKAYEHTQDLRREDFKQSRLNAETNKVKTKTQNPEH